MLCGQVSARRGARARLVGFIREEQRGADVVVCVGACVADAAGADPARVVVAHDLAAHAAAALAASEGRVACEGHAELCGGEYDVLDA